MDEFLAQPEKTDGHTAAHMAAACDRRDALHMLLKEATDKARLGFATDKNSATPLFAAVGAGSRGCVELLLQLAGGLRAEDEALVLAHALPDGTTLLHLAARQGADAVLARLLQHLVAGAARGLQVQVRYLDVCHVKACGVEWVHPGHKHQCIIAYAPVPSIAARDWWSWLG